MTCLELDERLDDYVDGALSPEDEQRVEAHLASCAACHEAERRTRRLLAHAAALPRSVAPPRDLWPSVERTIARERRFSGLFAWGRPMMLAAAATVVLGVVAALLWQGAPGAAGVKAVAIPTATPAMEPVSTVPVADPALAEAEREYEAAAKTLLAVLQQHRSRLSADDLARVEDNVAVIDRALAEVREALAKDPVNPELNRMLVATHRKKVDVLYRVVRLSTAL
jgi:predicted anti-sigma-YlaC factor YlaD